MLKGANRLLAATVLAVGSAMAGHAQPAVPPITPVELKVSHYLPPNHTVQKVLEDWAQVVEARSGGRLKLRIYPASQLGPVQRQFDLARNGQADMAVGLTGATPGRYPMTELASLPFVEPKGAVTSAAMSRRITELAPKYLAPEFAGLHLLWVGVQPLNTFFTARKEIDSLTDLKGLKMRFQGEQHAKVLRALGAVPLQVPPGEIADGMSKGVIDGAVFNYEAAESFGLASVTQHVMEPTFLPSTLLLAMNQAKYDALPPDLRAIIDDTTGPAAAEAFGARWDLAQQHGRDAMGAAKVGINTLAPAEVEKLRTTLQPVVRDDVALLDKAGKPASQFMEDYTR
jgi:TRAP-type C4-dicarboxylate transport system substrate-binding protein